MNKLVVFILAGLLAVGAVINILMGILGLTNSKSSELAMDVSKGSICEFKVKGASPVMNIKHSFKKIIPLGTEHFYVIVTDSSYSPLLVKASNSWFKKNFTVDGIAKKELTVKGEVSGYKGASAIKVLEINLKLAMEGIGKVSMDNYVDLLYRPRYITKIISGVLLLCAGFMLLMFFSRFGDISTTPAKVAFIGTGVVGLAGLVLFVMGLTVLR